jgi:hypothetical protein
MWALTWPSCVARNSIRDACRAQVPVPVPESEARTSLLAQRTLLFASQPCLSSQLLRALIIHVSYYSAHVLRYHPSSFPAHEPIHSLLSLPSPSCSRARSETLQYLTQHVILVSISTASRDCSRLSQTPWIAAFDFWSAVARCLRC